MESWTEIKISVDAKDIDRASDIANVVVPYGIYIEDYTNLEQEVEDIAHIDLIDEDLLAKDRNKAFVHIYLEPDVSPSEAVAFLSERYNAEGIKHSIELLDCLEEDWRNNWKKYFNPIEVGEKLLIRPSWRDDYDAGNRKVLNIDPGLAFGTGGHETTRHIGWKELKEQLEQAVQTLLSPDYHIAVQPTNGSHWQLQLTLPADMEYQQSEQICKALELRRLDEEHFLTFETVTNDYLNHLLGRMTGHSVISNHADESGVWLLCESNRALHEPQVISHAGCV